MDITKIFDTIGDFISNIQYLISKFIDLINIFGNFLPKPFADVLNSFLLVFIVIIVAKLIGVKK